MTMIPQRNSNSNSNNRSSSGQSLLLFIILVSVASLAATTTTAFHVNNLSRMDTAAAAAVLATQECSSTTRRSTLQRALLLIFSTTTCTSSANPVFAADDVIIQSTGKCANGEGEGCEALAENNELIRSLQRKSAEKRELNQREALNAYYMKNYPDVFAVSDKQLVKKMDGTFALYSSDEVQQLSREGKITVEYPKTKGGRIADLTQKPVKVLRE